MADRVDRDGEEEGESAVGNGHIALFIYLHLSNGQHHWYVSQLRIEVSMLIGYLFANDACISHTIGVLHAMSGQTSHFFVGSNQNITEVYDEISKFQ